MDLEALKSLDLGEGEGKTLNFISQISEGQEQTSEVIAFKERKNVFSLHF